LALESLQEGILPAEVALSQLPARLKDGGKTYSIRYQLINNANDRPDQSSNEYPTIPRDETTVPEKILGLCAKMCGTPRQSTVAP
jgi:hypothetical protein